MKWKDVKKYKINLEQAEENGGFIVFEEYEDWKKLRFDFWPFLGPGSSESICK